MNLHRSPLVDIPASLLEAIRSFPQVREVEHCGSTFAVSPFDFHATCPRCDCRLKLRAFSAGDEIEDVFDAVFEWMMQPGAEDLVRRRQEVIGADREPETEDGTDA